MKVSKAQSQENRAHIVNTASALFRERGYDGVSVADLMAAAGFTHGGFYKHFGSKADLMAETAECGMAQTLRAADGMAITDFIQSYVSRAHRDGRGGGCTMAALCGDAARQPAEIKATFAAGIDNMLASVEQGATRVQAINLFAQAIGAVLLSRACPDDSALADEILDVCRQQMLASLAAG